MDVTHKSLFFAQVLTRIIIRLKSKFKPKWSQLAKLPIILPIFLPIFLLLTLTGCGQSPKPSQVVGGTREPAHIPAGPHLFCLTNIGHSLAVFGTASSIPNQNPLTSETRPILSDPSGPWFDQINGYYISQVSSSGGGKNLLERFSPKTLLPTGTITFPANSNPTQLLIEPALAQWGWVALKGSTFDNFATVGIAVVNLNEMRAEYFHSLTELVPAEQRNNEPISSLLGFVWDEDCPSLNGACIYAVVENWYNKARQGWLLVLQPDSKNRPVLKGLLRLGVSPVLPILHRAGQSLWVVASGGYINFGGQPGYLQQISTANLVDNDKNNDILQNIPLADVNDCPSEADRKGCDPNGISLAPQANKAWIFTYVASGDSAIRVLDLSSATLAKEPLLIGPTIATRLNGPLFATQYGHFAGLGGYGKASLAKLSADGNSIEAQYPLNAGRGNLTCAPHTVL